MTAIARLDIDGLRNLSRVSIQPASRTNLVTGANGSGKTSLLEAIHILSLGRSFRSTRLDPLIQTDADFFHLFARFENGDTAGVQKSRDSRDRILKFNGEKQRNWQLLVSALPVQLFNSDSFSLLHGGSRLRRRYLDWGVFHVEHGFLPAWQAMARCLSQRNALLKKGRQADRYQLASWDQQFISATERVTRDRREYFGRLLPYLESATSELLPSLQEGVSYQFYQGWSDDQTYDEALSLAYEGDLRYGVTRRGPHRADLLIKVGGLPAEQVFSRGQQKMLVCAMKLAEIRSLQAINPVVRPVLLVDDLASELDGSNRQKVVEAMTGLGAQAFFTAIEAGDLSELMAGDESDNAGQIRQFHVEHGKIEAL
ncbi:MAG: DNA replication/repair protein RecF [Pseudohongiellaceae bacterium]